MTILLRMMILKLTMIKIIMKRKKNIKAIISSFHSNRNNSSKQVYFNFLVRNIIFISINMNRIVRNVIIISIIALTPPLITPLALNNCRQIYLWRDRGYPWKPTRMAVTTMGSNDLFVGEDHLLVPSCQQNNWQTGR